MSGSGKTTVAEKLLQQLNRGAETVEATCTAQWELISQDSYFCGEFVPYEVALRQGHTTIEDPSHIDFDKLKAAVREKLKKETNIILEGHALLSDKELHEMANISILIDVDHEICMERRISRKNRKTAEVDVYRTYYMKFVVPAHEKYQMPRIKQLTLLHQGEITSSMNHKVEQLTPAQESNTFKNDPGSGGLKSKDLLYVLDGSKTIDECVGATIIIMQQYSRK